MLPGAMDQGEGSVVYSRGDSGRPANFTQQAEICEAMNWSDPIVDEVRRVRDAYSARFNYDLRAIYCVLKEQEKRSGREIVSYAESSTGAKREQGRTSGPLEEVVGEGKMPL